MARSSLLQLVGAGGLASLAWMAGTEEGRRRGNSDRMAENSQIRNKMKERPPGLPLVASVSAAVAIQPSQETGVMVPSRDLDLLPEPGPEAGRVGQIMRFGFPGLDHIRSHSDYILSYDRKNRVPHWVFEHLTIDSVQRKEGVDRANCDFTEDLSIHKYFRSRKSDYKYSGYDRGHMAPAGNHRQNQKMCDETFLFTNMAPQVGKGFNRDKWEHLERYTRKLTKFYRNVYVCTGPLYLPHMEEDGKMYVKYEVIGQSNVAVPTHFFKVIVCETEQRYLEMEAFVLPNQIINDATPLEQFHVPPDSVERAAGLLFFDRLNRSRLTHVNRQKTGHF